MSEQKQQELAPLRMTPEVSAAVLADRCRKDDALSKRFFENPKAAIADASGKTLPEATNVVVHRNSADHWHIVVPSQAQARRLNAAWEGSGDGDSLTDEQLQAISGGLEIWIACLLAGGLLVAGLAAGAGVAASSNN